MFKSRTVMVVGAGASRELNLPIGAQLADTISHLLGFRLDDLGARRAGSPNIELALRQLAFDGEIEDARAYMESGKIVADAMIFARSIDNFLEAHAGKRAFEVCGKLAIVEAILAAERQSPLYPRKWGNPDLESLKASGTWHSEFVKFLTENVHLDHLDDLFNNLTFVVFNYDRCLEFFLYHAIRVYYALSPARTAEVLSKATFIHPYGRIGPLPWEVATADVIPFGADFDGVTLARTFANIRTYSEQVGDSDEVQAIRDAMLLAKQVIFLGFSYIDQNMKLLTAGAERLTNVYGTVLGFSQSDATAIQQSIDHAVRFPERIRRPHYELAPVTCLELFQQYSKSISR